MEIYSVRYSDGNLKESKTESILYFIIVRVRTERLREIDRHRRL